MLCVRLSSQCPESEHIMSRSPQCYELVRIYNTGIYRSLFSWMILHLERKYMLLSIFHDKPQHRMTHEIHPSKWHRIYMHSNDLSIVYLACGSMWYLDFIFTCSFKIPIVGDTIYMVCLGDDSGVSLSEHEGREVIYTSSDLVSMQQ
jgi:hypothetical protein